MPGLGYDGIEGDNDRVRIALITFAFNNARVINWLRMRGTHIKNENWAGLERVNEAINLQIQNDKVLLDRLQRPCSVFATFETEEGYNRALMYNEVVKQPDYHKYAEFIGREIEIQPASEPTDIIWENRFFTEEQRRIKSIIVSIIIAILLSLSFTIIYICQKSSLALKNKYPKLNCKEFSENYIGKRDTFQKEAINEYLHNFNAQETHFTGPLQCFCQSERVNKISANTNYKLLS